MIGKTAMPMDPNERAEWGNAEVGKDYNFRTVADQLGERTETIPAPPAPQGPSVVQTLAERGKRYGLFIGHSQVTQSLKLAIESELDKRKKYLPCDQKEALDMICHKIGRIVNGDNNYDDSWIDIAGYAQLVADRLRGVTR